MAGCRFIGHTIVEGKDRWNSFWIALSGASIGWMMGLSNSPVLASYLAPILGLIVTCLAAASALQTESKWIPKISTFAPVAVFLICCAIAMPAGIFVRSSDYLIATNSVKDPGDGGQFNVSIGDTNCALLRQSSASDAAIRIKSLTGIDPQIKKLVISVTSDESRYRALINGICE